MNFVYYKSYQYTFCLSFLFVLFRIIVAFDYNLKEHTPLPLAGFTLSVETLLQNNNSLSELSTSDELMNDARVFNI